MHRRWGAALRAARLAVPLTQLELGRRAGCVQAHVSDLELGRVGPSDALKMKLSEAIGCPVADIFAWNIDDRRQAADIVRWFDDGGHRSPAIDNDDVESSDDWVAP